jgi:hypothetical protein
MCVCVCVSLTRGCLLAFYLLPRLTNDETPIPRAVPAFGSASDRTAVHPHFHRLLEDTGNEDLCDAAFLGCLQDDPCVDCFVELETKEIDWASVAPNTPCADVVKFLNAKDNCKSLASGAAVAAVPFCKTFDACVDWGDENGNNSNSNNADQKIDCKALTDCEFPGIHAQFLGDGICHERAGGCYNSAGRSRRVALLQDLSRDLVVLCVCVRCGVTRKLTHSCSCIFFFLSLRLRWRRLLSRYVPDIGRLLRGMRSRGLCVS